ncbi:hypothetical protein B0H19DRAFT_1224383 [Mycena capillaripes]|nr:hypothetical protein B0H19DRAFT_1224383 [Mycena capillaripes]
MSTSGAEPSSTGEPSSTETSPSERAGLEAIVKSMVYHKLLEDSKLPPKILGIPLKQLYPGDWNWHFERAYRLKYGPNADLQAWRDENFDLELPGMMEYMGNLRRCNMEISTTTQALLEAEGMLVGQAIEQLVYSDFETAWTALDVEAKKHIVLDGLVRGAFKAREESRFDCPEMSLFGLIADNEYSLINLLKAIVAHDPTGNLRVKSLYLFSHPAVESEYAYRSRPHLPDDLRAFAHLRIIQRNFYIVQALIGILDAFAGEPAPKISFNAENESKQRVACFSCHASNEDGPTVTLKRCSGCKLVAYCSRECQQRDWREHKKLCTAPVRFDPALVTPAPAPPAEFIGCPAPAAGFVRTPALWKQIWYLSKKDSYRRDYHFDMAPGHTRSVRIPDPVGRTMFLIARRRAMTSGDRGAVYKMHSILEQLQRSGYLAVTAEQIRDQLEREYRVALMPRGDFGPVPTQQEFLEEMMFATQRDQLGDEELARAQGGGAGNSVDREYDHADIADEWEEGTHGTAKTRIQAKYRGAAGCDEVRAHPTAWVFVRPASKGFFLVH